MFARLDDLLFLLAVAPPQIASLSPTGEVLPDTRQWVITFDKQVKLFQFSPSPAISNQRKNAMRERILKRLTEAAKSVK